MNATAALHPYPAAGADAAAVAPPAPTPRRGAPVRLDLGEAGRCAPSRFDALVNAERTRLSYLGDREPPALLEAALRRRLAAYRFTTLDAVRLVVHALAAYESEPYRTRTLRSTQPDAGAAAAAEEKAPTYPLTLALLADLLPLCDGRPELEAELRSLRVFYSSLRPATPANRRRDLDDALRAASLLRDAGLALDKARVGATLAAAYAAADLARKNEADSLYLRAAGYGWWGVDDPALFHWFRDAYGDAIRGLIAVRRGNLEALGDIRYAPAIEERVGRELRDALREASEGATPQPPSP